MVVECPVCKGTRILETDDYSGPCYHCNGTGMCKSNRQLKKESFLRDKERYIQDLNTPKVNVFLSLPMFKRELDNMGEMGFISSDDVVKTLQKYIKEQ